MNLELKDSSPIYDKVIRNSAIKQDEDECEIEETNEFKDKSEVKVFQANNELKVFVESDKNFNRFGI